MSATWVLVADSARARLFETAEPEGLLCELGCYTNAESRDGARGLTHDRRPTVNESMGFARHAIEPHTTSREKAAGSFAHTLREVLEQGRNAHRFERLVLIAPPRFLGALRTAFGTPLREAVVAEIRRDFTQLSVEKIREQLPAGVLH